AARGRVRGGIGRGGPLGDRDGRRSRSGGMSIGDDGDLVDSDHRWEWHVDAGTPYLDAHGDRLYEDVYVSAPAGDARSTPAHRIGVTHAQPPANARVTRVQTVSDLEATKEGLRGRSTPGPPRTRLASRPSLRL